MYTPCMHWRSPKYYLFFQTGGDSSKSFRDSPPRTIPKIRREGDGISFNSAPRSSAGIASFDVDKCNSTMIVHCFQMGLTTNLRKASPGHFRPQRPSALWCHQLTSMISAAAPSESSAVVMPVYSSTTIESSTVTSIVSCCAAAVMFWPLCSTWSVTPITMDVAIEVDSQIKPLSWKNPQSPAGLAVSYYTDTALNLEDWSQVAIAVPTCSPKMGRSVRCETCYFYMDSDRSRWPLRFQ